MPVRSLCSSNVLSTVSLGKVPADQGLASGWPGHAGQKAPFCLVINVATYRTSPIFLVHFSVSMLYHVTWLL